MNQKLSAFLHMRLSPFVSILSLVVVGVLFFNVAFASLGFMRPFAGRITITPVAAPIACPGTGFYITPFNGGPIGPYNIVNVKSAIHVGGYVLGLYQQPLALGPCTNNSTGTPVAIATMNVIVYGASR